MIKKIYLVTIDTPYGTDNYVFDNEAKADDAYTSLFLKAMNAYGYDEQTCKGILEGEIEAQDVFAKTEVFHIEVENRLLEINWELDLDDGENYDDKVREYKLPTLIETTLNDEEIANNLSDKYGWLINGFNEVK